MKKIGVVIVAAGKGERLGNKTPKGLVKISGREMFLYSLAAFQFVRGTTFISIVIPHGKGLLIKKAIDRAGLQPVHALVDGGKLRQDSVRLGLESLPSDTDIVLIHDSARPFLLPKQIKDMISLVEKYGSATTARRVGDTLRRGSSEKNTVFLKTIVDRDNLWALGTPQGFIHKTILSAHRQANHSGRIVSDDTALIPSKKPVAVLETDFLNSKITYPSDLQMAEMIAPIWRSVFTKNGGKLPDGF
jgi:2-C-methyl-D-erythritol 4-phosphate cytidylyltransferase